MSSGFSCLHIGFVSVWEVTMVCFKIISVTNENVYHNLKINIGPESIAGIN